MKRLKAARTETGADPVQRHRFLNRIRSALNHPNSGRGAPAAARATSKAGPHHQGAAGARPCGRPEELLQRLQEAAAELNIHLSLHDSPASAGRCMAAMITRKAPPRNGRREVAIWRHPLVARLELPQRLAGAAITCRTTAAADRTYATRRRFYRDLEAAAVGVTSADYCLADTATLVMRSRPGQPRSVSLLPDIHAAVIEAGQLLPDFSRLCRLLSSGADEGKRGLTHCMTLISGPSKTADIEAVMVEGAHGPRALYLYVILAAPIDAPQPETSGKPRTTS